MEKPKKYIRVLIVDDSAFMRNAIKSMLTSDPDIQVVGVARDGVEAIEKVATLKPDIMTLDVEMPRMNGLETLKILMEKSPLPVIMVSSLTTDGAKVTLDALDMGAVDFIPKNLSELSVNIVNIKLMLIDKIKQIGSKGLKVVKKTSKVSSRLAVHVSTAKNVQFTSSKRMNIIAIGTSTGGPKALQSIVPMLPKNISIPIVISQHMPHSFTGPFAERLNQLSQVCVREAKNGEKLQSGIVYIAPGCGHMSIVKKGIEKYISISESNEYIYKPSVDVMMLSVAQLYPGNCLGVILTGMGNDGLKGMKAIKESDGRTIAQDEESCVVYGMPKAVVDAGIVDKIVSLAEVAGEIINSI
ncbi:MAG: chemotaxis response regulator protein-glutamate methylesterase [Candidatus Magnetobacterium sp. LHC-1]|uniref:Protein-glutamate methylesterase/protein-glutamine glutaminase n=1 Tax=Candidatus Magnetobacterium casense TaxID=1455061 RepID=A0ABS6RZ60_9BACT|nr:chemotaxis response regulator protein-glutamate methylesterase [Candidatus Magnetobacterium casensis]MBF0608257.1 chemotaxis response regulator protein-glutamate methylesterase [Nitrospirota bacterium]MBV6341635.1 chemotaxis response regulator protein-glutamate methylesterase [Candidatus Magnetobacterium casensis]